MSRTPSGVLAVFEYVDSAVAAVHALRAQKIDKFTVTSPIAHHELMEAIPQRATPGRWFVLTGGLIGFATALTLTIWTSTHWGLVTGGKAIVSLPPFMIITFELTVLIGSLFNLISMIGLAGMPAWNAREPYDPRFSEDRIGVWVPCSGAEAERVGRLLRDAGAEEVRVEAR